MPRSKWASSSESIILPARRARQSVLQAAELHEIHFRSVRNNPCLIPHVQQLPHRLSSIVAVIERALVHIHPDKLIGGLLIKIAGELHRILQRLLAIVQRILNTLLQRRAHAGHKLRAKLAADGVPTERKRKPGELQPPLAAVEDLLQP